MNKEQLLEAFSVYLDRAEDQVEEQGDQAQAIDLHGLFTEMAGLRGEVKAESRHFKDALDEFHGVFGALRESHEALKEALASREDEYRRRNRDTLRGVLSDMVEVRDRVAAGLQALDNFKPGFLGGGQQRRFMASVREGQEVVLNRVDDLMTRCGLRAVETVGQPLDARTMRVVETVNDPARDSGIVVEELRKGFVWEDEVLQPAEVRANGADE